MGRRTCLPVLAKHQVRVVQGCCAPHMRPLLTIVSHVEGDPALWVKGSPEAQAWLCWATSKNCTNSDQLLMTPLISRYFLRAALGLATLEFPTSWRNCQTG